VDTEDFATALTREQSQRSFHVVENDQELEAMLVAPLEKWRVFLHPSQRRLVNWRTNGPVRVLGGAGTGKTVVAMHRARWLVGNALTAPDRKVLFTTFTANLATDIGENLRKICSVEELGRIEVVHIDAWVSRFLKRQNYPHQIVYDGNPQYEECWKLALDGKPADPLLPDSFFREEWDRVIVPQRVVDRNEYFRARRTGRGVPLTRAQRGAIWAVFEELRIQLHQRGLKCSEDATQDAADLLEAGKAYLPYNAVVVDEAQDMGPEVMRLIRRLVPPHENDIFIVGDGHQRIYRRRYALSACGIEVRGRSRKLRINYRTTEETRRFATAVLQGEAIDDLDGGEDTSGDYRSLMHGQAPVVQGFESQREELDRMVQEIQRMREQGEALQDICVVARTNALVDAYQSGLQERGLPCVRLSRKLADNRSQEGVRLATMHRVKGLEFRHIMLVGANEGVLPLRQAIESSEDPTERRAGELTERALFHVAATRAINRLFVSWFGSPSPFLVSGGG
jgi:superfamily I DNA/RNA helicase